MHQPSILITGAAAGIGKATAVGLQTKLMIIASKLTPAWLLRLSNKWISG